MIKKKKQAGWQGSSVGGRQRDRERGGVARSAGGGGEEGRNDEEIGSRAWGFKSTHWVLCTGH